LQQTSLDHIESDNDPVDLPVIEEDNTWEQRDRLPVERDPNNRPSVWKMLKDMIGKDLSRFAIPVYFNEPLSFIQKFCEVLECNELINRADAEDDPMERLLLMTTFAITQYPS
jgi:hypothetical protein